MNIKDENIIKYSKLLSPEELQSKYPLSENSKEFILSSRKSVEDILEAKDDRKIIILGPCSIHNYEEAIEYANFVKELQEKVKDKFLLIMRTYFEKPRSTIGWKGLLYDPFLNGSEDIESGLKISRHLLCDIASLGVPTATEFLGVLVPQYISDLVTWAAIGARTTESQSHREFVSGLSLPVGFKNSTFGSVDIAINAMISSENPHSFIGIDESGLVSKVYTKGNKYVHLILRGGKKPNFDSVSISEIVSDFENHDFKANLIVDCSHGNSNKDFKNQSIVFKDLINQINGGRSEIIGLMLESNISEGSQKLIDPKKLEKGISITDACISKETTEELILWAYNFLN